MKRPKIRPVMYQVKQQIYDALPQDGATLALLYRMHYIGEHNYLENKTKSQCRVQLVKDALQEMEQEDRAFLCPVRRKVFKGISSAVRDVVGEIARHSHWSTTTPPLEWTMKYVKKLYDILPSSVRPYTIASALQKCGHTKVSCAQVRRAIKELSKSGNVGIQESTPFGRFYAGLEPLTHNFIPAPRK